MSREEHPFWGRQHPAVRVFAILAAGVAIASQIETSLLTVALAGTVSLLVAVSALLCRSGLLAYLSVLALGIFLYGLHDPQLYPNHYIHLMDREGVWEITVEEVPVNSGRWWRVPCSVEALWLSADSTFTLKGTALCLLDTSGGIPVPGDRIAATGKLKQIESLPIPSGFDYRRWAHSKGWHGIITSTNWARLDRTTTLYTLAQRIRLRLISLIEAYIRSPAEQGLATAISTGWKGLLPIEVRQAYSLSGAVHIMAISGLHVGMILALLGGAVALIKKRMALPVPAWLELLIVGGGVWFFVFMTGLSASAVRAAMMFTLLWAGKLFSEDAPALNTWGGAGTLMLMINPRWLFDIGFQFSFLAVAGILLFYRRLYSLLVVKNRLADWIWRLCVVSISAQALVLPLTLYYFGQVPLAFLAANLVLVPLAGVLLYGVCLLWLTGWTGWIATLAGKVVSATAAIMNGYALWLAELGLTGRVKGFGDVELALSYGGTALLVAGIYENGKVQRLLVAGSLLLLTGAGACTLLHTLTKPYSAVHVWAFSEGISLELVERGRCIRIIGESLLPEYQLLENLKFFPAEQTLLYSCEHVMTFRDVLKNCSNKPCVVGTPALYAYFGAVQDLLIAWVNPLVKVAPISNSSIHTNLLVVVGSTPYSLIDLYRIFTPDKVVVAIDRQSSRRWRLKYECKSLPAECIIVEDSRQPFWRYVVK